MPTPKTIGLDQLDRLGVDENNKLYWDGKPLVTEERIVLAGWVNAAIVLGAMSTFVLAGIEVLRFCGIGRI